MRTHTRFAHDHRKRWVLQELHRADPAPFRPTVAGSPQLVTAFPQPSPQSMPKALKYSTDAERLQARRESRRKYYYKCVHFAGRHARSDPLSNLEQERQKAQERVRRTRQSHGRPVREALSAQATLLPATCAVRDRPRRTRSSLMFSLCSILVHPSRSKRTFSRVRSCKRWRRTLSWNEGVHAHTVWERLTLRLVREERRRHPSARLRRALAIKRQHAQMVEDVTTAGARKAWLEGGPESLAYCALQDVSGRASQILSGLDELEGLAGLADGTLERCHSSGNLIYQRS